MPHAFGLTKRRARTALERRAQLGERQLRRAVEGRDELAGDRVGIDLARDLQQQPGTADHEPQPQQLIGALGAEDDVAGRPGPARTGVSIDTVPTFEESGQVGSASVPSLRSASEQAPRPSAEAGETRVPAGNATTALRSVGVAKPLTDSSCGTVTSTSYPEGVPAVVTCGRALIVASNYS